MIIDHYHTILAGETMRCIQCRPNVRYREDLPCAVVTPNDGILQVVPLIRVGTALKIVK